MENEQIAQENCLPLPETCVKLDWKGETKLYWVKHTQKDNWEIHSSTNIMTNPILVLFKAEYIFIPAPNANQLFEALPNIHIIDNYLCTKYSIFFDREFNQNYIKKAKGVIIQNNNLAEALAKLYILLREKGLLPTT